MKMRILVATSLLLSQLTINSAFAESECKNVSGEMPTTECAEKELGQQDNRLNLLYKKINFLLADDVDRKKLLTNAQRAWIKFRDEQCEYDASQFKGGRMENLVRLQCLSAMTASRNKQFQSMISNIEN